MGAPIMKLEPRRQSNDCAVWSLAMYLGKPYDEVWQVVQKLDRSKGRDGLHTATMRRVAKKLGHPLLKLPATKITDDSYGVIAVTHPQNAHAAVVRNGLVFDVDMTVWDLPTWLEGIGYTIECLLTEEEP
jgi:ABC-type bacteriocin/lantibiotic exporter with double-glycine peptidase domain